MIAEIGVAVAAYKTIRSAVESGKELIDCGKAVDAFFDSKSNIQKAVNATQKTKGGYKDHDLWTEFQNLNKIKAMEKELYEVCIYAGRPNLWPDWLEFQKQAKERRDKVEKQLEAEAYKRRKVLNEIFQTFFLTLVGIGVIAIIFAVVVR